MTERGLENLLLAAGVDMLKHVAYPTAESPTGPPALDPDISAANSLRCRTDLVTKDLVPRVPAASRQPLSPRTRAKHRKPQRGKLLRGVRNLYSGWVLGIGIFSADPDGMGCNPDFIV